MPLNLSYSQPPWLEKQGTGASGFLEDVQRVVNIREARETLPLRLQALQQNAEMSRLKQEEFIRQREELLSAERAAVDLSGKISPLLRSGQHMEALNLLLAEGASNHLVSKSPQFQSLLDGTMGAIKLETTRRQIEAVNNPESFQNWLRLQNLQARQEGLDLGQANLAQRQAGTELRTNQAIQSAAQAEASLKEKGFTSTVPLAPGQAPGTSLLQPAARPPTTATVTTAQESLRNLENSLAAVDRAEKAVESTPEAFGPLGGLRQSLEVVRTFVFPGQPAPITAARTTADVAAEDIIRGMKQDSQMSVFEKKQLDRSARITGAADTPDVAKAKLDIIKVGIAGKAIRDARILNLPITEQLQATLKQAQTVIDTKADLSAYTEEELIDAVNKGFISFDRALQEYDARKTK